MANIKLIFNFVLNNDDEPIEAQETSVRNKKLDYIEENEKKNTDPVKKLKTILRKHRS